MSRKRPPSRRDSAHGRRGRSRRAPSDRGHTPHLYEPRPLRGNEKAALAAALLPLADPSRQSALLAQLIGYLELVLSWNVRGNLVSARDADRIVERHALDSLAAVPLIDEMQPSELLDLGSGGGFPGLPIKIARPSLPVTLVEGRRMKSLFLVRVIRDLGLVAVRVWQRRIEALASLPVADGGADRSPGRQQALRDPLVMLEGPTERPAVDLVTARAVAPLAKLARWIEPLVRPGGHLVAYKGGRMAAEIAAWRASPGAWELGEIRTEIRPHTHLVVLRRV